MTKVVRIPLICCTLDENGNEIDYKKIFKLLWDLQDETRRVKNKAIQLLWEWYDFSSEYKKQHGEYPSNEETLGYKGGIRSYLYGRVKDGTLQNGQNLPVTVETARAQFQAGLKDYVSGKRSIIEYKGNQPLELHNRSIKLEYVNDEYIFTLSILSKNGAQARNMPMRFAFKSVVNDKSTSDILNRCMLKSYKISDSRLVYDKKKKWCLNLSYSFSPMAVQELDADKILGIDLGVAKPFVASIYGDWKRISADGGENSEIEVFRRRVEQRRRSMLRQSKICADGRIGHGYKTRTLSANKLGDKIQQFRETVNHKYSRAIVEYAVKNNCGVIQMEDLSGITAGEKPMFLKHWTYYDLQQKIENKASEYGIRVRYIDPKYTSQRCSKCGFIHKENRPDQATFTCQSCGFETNADYNASQNIAIKDIDKIIKADLKNQP